MNCPRCGQTHPETADCPATGSSVTPGGDAGIGLEMGTLLADRYRLIKPIGSGGMATVYLASHEPIDRRVALKFLSRQLAHVDEAVQRFLHEAKAVSRLRSPRTVTLYDFGELDSGELYLAMEYLEGGTLSQRLREGPVSPAQAVNIVYQVCESLAEAHAKGIIHRDLKPDNILFDLDANEPDALRVADFGIAKLCDDSTNLTRTGRFLGTPSYVAPEVVCDLPADHRTDIYSLGCIFYEMISGRVPFRADTPISVVYKHVHEAPVPLAELDLPAGIDPAINALVMSMLAKEPGDRPENVQHVMEALRALGASVVLTTPVPVGSMNDPPATSSPRVDVGAGETPVDVANTVEETTLRGPGWKPKALYGGIIAVGALVILYVGWHVLREPPLKTVASTVVNGPNPTTSPTLSGVKTQTPAVAKPEVPVEKQAPDAHATQPLSPKPPTAPKTNEDTPRSSDRSSDPTPASVASTGKPKPKRKLRPVGRGARKKPTSKRSKPAEPVRTEPKQAQPSATADPSRPSTPAGKPTRTDTTSARASRDTTPDRIATGDCETRIRELWARWRNAGGDKAQKARICREQTKLKAKCPPRSSKARNWFRFWARSCKDQSGAARAQAGRSRGDVP